MPLDAVCLQAVVAELAPQITGSRIEKIQQPARDQAGCCWPPAADSPACT